MLVTTGHRHLGAVDGANVCRRARFTNMRRSIPPRPCGVSSIIGGPTSRCSSSSEFWPNLILETHARGVPMALINARMSERSFRGWSRAGALAKLLLSSFDECLAQDDATGTRLKALGAQVGEGFGQPQGRCAAAARRRDRAGANSELRSARARCSSPPARIRAKRRCSSTSRSSCARSANALTVHRAAPSRARGRDRSQRRAQGASPRGGVPRARSPIRDRGLCRGHARRARALLSRGAVRVPRRKPGPAWRSEPARTRAAGHRRSHRPAHAQFRRDVPRAARRPRRGTGSNGRGLACSRRAPDRGSRAGAPTWRESADRSRRNGGRAEAQCRRSRRLCSRAMRAPDFWNSDGLAARLLAPLGALYGLSVRRATGARASVPLQGARAVRRQPHRRRIGQDADCDGACAHARRARTQGRLPHARLSRPPCRARRCRSRETQRRRCRRRSAAACGRCAHDRRARSRARRASSPTRSARA